MTLEDANRELEHLTEEQLLEIAAEVVPMEELIAIQRYEDAAEKLLPVVAAAVLTGIKTDPEKYMEIIGRYPQPPAGE